MKTIIKNTENFYQLEEDARYYISKSGKVYSEVSNKIIKPFKNTNGYWQYQVGTKPERQKILIHRTLAKLFIKKPFTDCVEACFKDSNRDNYLLENIEWLTPSQKNFKTLYKVDYKNRKALRIRNIGGMSSKIEPKPIIQTKNGKPIKIWDSMFAAGKVLGIRSSSISLICNNKRKSAKGYSFKFL